MSFIAFYDVAIFIFQYYVPEVKFQYSDGKV